MGRSAAAQVVRNRALEQSVSALAQAAVESAPVRITFPEQTKTLSTGEVLVAIADAGSVTLSKVHAPAFSTTRLAQFQSAFMELVRADMIPSLNPVAALTQNEDDILRSGGFDLTPLPPDVINPVTRATAEFASLVIDSYNTEEAARVLHVNTSRVRQRVAGKQRTLFGFKLVDEWRIPKFQFSGKHVVAGLDRVIEHLPSNLHPVAAYRWFTSSNPDLSLGDEGETPVSPLDWLKMGNSPDAVAELASNL